MSPDLQRLIIEEKEKETAAVDTAALTAGKGKKKLGKDRAKKNSSLSFIEDVKHGRSNHKSL